MVLFLCTSSDSALYVTKLSWRNLIQFLRYGADTKLIWNYYKKNAKGNNPFKTESKVMVLFLCTLSDGALYLYKLSWRNLKRFLRYGADTKLLWNYLWKIQRGIIPSKLKVRSWFFFSAHCLIVLYICTYFHEEILKGFRDMEWTWSLYETSKFCEFISPAKVSLICLWFTLSYIKFRSLVT